MGARASAQARSLRQTRSQPLVHVGPDVPPFKQEVLEAAGHVGQVHERHARFLRRAAGLAAVAGRAGRDAALGGNSEVWIQTAQPAHPLYAALKQHDYPAFAEQQLQERRQAGMPPFSAQALVRAEAKTQEAAQALLNAARQTAQTDMPTWPGWSEVLAHITLYPAVPMAVQRVANIERAQMLIESPSRAALQQFLAGWQSVLQSCRSQPECKGLIRWAIDVDPLAI